MVYVDECAIWPTTIACMRGGSCHLTADTIEELHAFAARIGLRRGWAQIEGHRVPHYDLTPARRARAVEAGAVFVPAKEQARRRIAARAAAAVRGAGDEWARALSVPREHLDPPGSAHASVAPCSPTPHAHPRDESAVLAHEARGAVGDDERDVEGGPRGDDVR